MLRKLWHDPVWSKVIAATLITVVISAGGYVLGLMPLVKVVLSSIWSFVISQTSVPNWLIAVFSVPILVLIFGVVSAGVTGLKKTDDDVTTWESYRSDSFYSLNWSWEYSKSGKISKLYTLCPACSYQILPHQVAGPNYYSHYIEYKCDECGYKVKTFKEEYDTLLSKIERKIQRNIRTGDWAG